MLTSSATGCGGLAPHASRSLPLLWPLAGFLAVVLAPAVHWGMAAAIQSGPQLTRTFSAGESRQYRIQLVVRTDVGGSHAEKVGTKAYLRPFDESAEQTMQWRATIRVTRILRDGSAQMGEGDDGFSVLETHALGRLPHAATLQDSLRATLGRWMPSSGRTLTCSYSEARSGGPSQVPPNCGPALQEDSPALLTRWLLLAIRPAVALPVRPIELGATWTDPRAVQLPGWSAIEASEENSWLAPDENAATEPAVQLLTVQQIAGNVASPENSAGKSPVNSPAKSNPADAHAAFHAESLATVSLQGGAVLAASRSGSRELSWVPALAKGAGQPPHFHARLAAEITIEECHGSCATR
jgi:hypothetical protein